MLALSVISSQSQSLGVNSYRLFDESGGVIGRNDDSQMVLPDASKTVSGHHARILCQGGSYYVIDTSTNGTCLNSPDRRLPRNQPVELSDGDRLIIGDYEIVAQIVPMAAQSKPAPAARSPWDAGGPGQRAPEPPYPAPQPGTAQTLSDEPQPSFFGGDTLDPIQIMGGNGRENGISGRARQTGEMSQQLAGGSALQQHYTPPVVQPATDDTGPLNPYDITGYARDYSAKLPPRQVPPFVGAGQTGRGMPGTAPVSVPPPPRPTSRPPVMAETAGILEGLGLNPAQVPPEIAQQLGQILRVVVEGMVDVLQARAQVKNQFRLDRTEVRSVENNPLKLSANAEHAIQNLFLTSNPAFLPPVAAFEDAFRDLRFHQLAMIAGIRAAFNAMLKKFEPDTLEAAFERKGKRPSLVDFGSRGRLWEQYRGRFAEMTEDAEANFQRLFGEEFARAYSEQLRRLSAGQRDGRR